MKKLGLLALSLFFLAGCGSDSSRTYSGTVSVNCMNNTANATTCQGSAQLAKSLMTAATTSLSDLATTITTTFQGGDVSISLDSTINMQGSVVNDTPNTVVGLWYLPITYPISGNPNFTAGYWGGDIITLQPGETFNFYGGGGFGSGSYPGVPGAVEWTAYFYDVTGETNVPDVSHDGIDAVIAYTSTRTPRAVGVLQFNLVP